jgi:hypothetical protein
MSSKSEKGRNTSTVSKVRSLHGMDGKKIVHCRAEDYRHAAHGVSVLSHVRNLEKKGGRVGVAFLLDARSSE